MMEPARKEPQAFLQPDPALYRPGDNCWRVEPADFAAIIVDCGNYYRALHEAICAATKSVFVMGWDIDSRIELLRGGDVETASAPSRFFDLVKWKAQQNPEIQFYLNRWDYTIYQAGEREGFSLLRWRLFVPDNVHFHLDNTHPVGACHHQKIVVIDDEVAFIGGMDVAIGRWDYRSHHPENSRRVDPGGTYQPRTRQLFGPHHDVMMVAAGPVAKALGQLARKRWQQATGTQPSVLGKERARVGLPRTWPAGVAPHFTRTQLALARTMPPLPHEEGIHEIEKLFLHEIAQAEHFIYIENQYLTSAEIARALNRQLFAKPDLRILLVSCHEPQGVMERKAMWHGRVLFHDLLVQGGMAGRVIMAYPVSREYGVSEAVRIHSKLMVIDDRILHIGSANLNNRSMRLDSECDISIEGNDRETKRQIADIRNDLIREHTGWPLEQIERVIAGHDKLERLLFYRSESRQHLCRIDDEKYRYQSFSTLAMRIADPKEAFFARKYRAPSIPAAHGNGHLGMLLFVVAAIACLVLVWKLTPLKHYIAPSHIAPYFMHVRHSVWAIPAVIGVYIAATMVFFPLTILILATAIAFSPLQALLLAFGGMICSACCGYAVGRVAGLRSLRFLTGGAAEKISQYTKNGGVAGVTLLRMVPLAPLGVVDFSLGMAKVPFLTYIAGTILGLVPGILAFTFLGHSVGRIWRHLNVENIAYLAVAIGGWIGVVVLSHILARRGRLQPSQ